MRIHELLSGIHIHLNLEESALLDKIKQHPSVPKNKLTEREMEVARFMTSKGILDRIKIDGTIHYKSK